MEYIVDEKCDPEELRKTKKQYEDQVSRGQPSARAAFNYAYNLIRSSKGDANHGVKILEELLNGEDEEGAKREYIYYLALAHIRIGNYDVALKYLDVLLRAEPTNQQAAALREVAEAKMRKQGMIGAAVLGGGALVVGGILAGVIAAVARK